MAPINGEEPRSLDEREARIAVIDARLAEIDAEYEGQLMPDSVREEWNQLNTERDEQQATVLELRRRRERLQSIAANRSATERAVTDVPSFVPRRTDAEIYDVEGVRFASRSADEYRQRLHDNARRAIERASFPAFAGTREQVQTHVEDLLARVDDRNGTLARHILATGSPIYDRAFGKVLLRGPHTLTSDEQRAMSLTDAQGGFAVPFQLDPTVILTNAGSLAPLRQIARVETIVSKTWQGITSSGVSVSRSSEGAEAADNSFTVAQPEVSPTRVIADIRFSVEIDQDWSQLRTEIGRLLADGKDREEDSSFVIGDGTPPNPSGVVATLPSGSVVNVGAAGTLAVDDLYGLEAALPPRWRSRGRFLANKSIYNEIRGLSTGSDGGDLWVRLGAAQPAELLGYPAHEASAMASLGAAGNRVLLFGDFSEFLIVDRLGMTVELNPHIVGSNGRWTGQRAIVAVWRNSSLVLVPEAFRVLADVA